MSVAARLAQDLGSTAQGAVLAGTGVSLDASSLGSFGADKIVVIEHDALADYNPEAWVSTLEDLIREGEYGVVVFSATTLGKDLAPRIAARLDVPLASDVTAVDISDGMVSVTRPVFSGKRLLISK